MAGPIHSLESAVNEDLFTYDVYWSPEGRCIATVLALTAQKAVRKAPQPYRKYLGEMYAYRVLRPKEQCNGEWNCNRHAEHRNR